MREAPWEGTEATRFGPCFQLVACLEGERSNVQRVVTRAGGLEEDAKEKVTFGLGFERG